MSIFSFSICVLQRKIKKHTPSDGMSSRDASSIDIPLDESLVQARRSGDGGAEDAKKVTASLAVSDSLIIKWLARTIVETSAALIASH
jgi:hypothetical protein